MAYEVEATDEWLAWFEALTAKEQEELAARIGLLEAKGPHLPFPYSSGVSQSGHTHMRELRAQIDGRPFRTLCAFDPRRVAILLIAGDKTGDDWWYEVYVSSGRRPVRRTSRGSRDGGFDLMATKFQKIRERMAPDRRARIRKRTEELLGELPLQELRQARALSQEELAEVLGLNQATISKLERRADMYLSSLRRFIEAMGGELEITANFPEGRVRIQLFEDLEEVEG